MDGSAHALAERALRRDPNAASPLVMLALEATQQGKDEAAQKLMETARDREPANRPARLWLLARYMRVGDFKSGLNEMAPVMRLYPAAVPQITAVLLALMDVPAARAALRDKLAEAPVWRPLLVQAAAATLTDLRPLTRLLVSIPPLADAAEARSEQRAILTNMVSRGEYGEAHTVWQSWLPPRARGSGAPGLIYDTRFEGLPGAEPFNWALAQNGSASATMSADQPGLALYSAASGEAIIAEQIAIVPPGTYRLQATEAADSAADALDSERIFELRVVCATGADGLAALPIPDASATAQTLSTMVTVPAKCRAVRFQFVAVVRETPGDTRVRIDSVRLLPAK